MTVLISLGEMGHASTAGPSRRHTPHLSNPTTAFASSSDHLDDNVERLLDAVADAKRIVAITGAGISTAAAIPDFRSATGLFGAGTVNKGKGREKTPSVRDLFHVDALKTPRSLLKHHELIARLAVASLSAEPTPFHRLLAQLDNRKSLLRCYTQNIDDLEAKAGLSCGITARPPSTPRKRKCPANEHVNPFLLTPPPSQQASTASPSPTVEDVPESLKRVVPLHGTLSSLFCPLCKHTEPIRPHLPDLAQMDDPPPCPNCSSESYIRRVLAERPRRTGFLRPSVVLYGEDHPQADRIGEIVHLDTYGRGREAEGKVDLLLVAGTTLAIPGVKRMIKEMQKMLEHQSKDMPRKGGLPRNYVKGIRTIFINNEPPQNPSIWKDVFDIFVQGDVQDFARRISDRLARPMLPDLHLPPTPATQQKRKPTEDSSSFMTPPSKTARQKPTKRISQRSPRTTPAISARKKATKHGRDENATEGAMQPSTIDVANPFLFTSQ